MQLAATGTGRSSGADSMLGQGRGEEFVGVKLMRAGEDPRDVHWRKTAAVGQMVMRERAREMRPDVTLTLDAVRPAGSGDEWLATFERGIRDVASRSVAHLKRGDRVSVHTTSGGLIRADRAFGADPLLRYLALLEPVLAPPLAAKPPEPEAAE